MGQQLSVFPFWGRLKLLFDSFWEVTSLGESGRKQSGYAALGVIPPKKYPGDRKFIPVPVRIVIQ
jgi:hypothetical protein